MSNFGVRSKNIAMEILISIEHSFGDREYVSALSAALPV
jgi:hypothetical protein